MRSELDVRMLPVMAEAENIADPKERSRRIDKLTTQVLEEMINEQLIVEAAEAQHIEVEADDINATLDDIKKQNNLDDAGLAQALSQQGYTLAGYRADLRKQLLRLRAINQMVRPKVNVSDEDVRARYDQMNRRTDGTSAVRLSHMLFRLPDHATEQQIADAKNRAGAALSRVRAGEAFDKVAGELSEDDATKTTGGELGWFSRGSLSVPEWETVVFAMEKGDVRGPVTGPQGFHLFMVSEIKRSETKPFNDMKEQVRNELTRRAMEKQTQVWLDDLRKKAFVEIKLDANAAP
jgi:parvulin-like peptidyl-prolyl isomerase